MTRTLTIEWRALTGSVQTVPMIHDLITHHDLEWMARSVGPYNKEMMREFDASYLTTLLGSLDRRANPTKHTPLTFVRVRGCRVDISFTTIYHFLYGEATDARKFPLTSEFD